MKRIGLLDSGIGGLTVLRRLRAAFPGPDMVYLGDVARVPYGGRGVDTINRYAADDVEFLLRRGVEAVVAACGTVSSNSLDYLKEHYDLPLFGVIDSAAKKAARRTRAGAVGVIGTQATVKSGAFRRKLLEADGSLRVISRACPLIVPLVENGVAPDDELALLACGRYLEPFLAEDLLETFGPIEGAGTTEYYATERSAAFDELVRNIDPEVDPAAIRVSGINE